MRGRGRLGCLALIVLWVLGAPRAQAQGRDEEATEVEQLPSGKHCLGEPRTKLLFSHSLVGAINPLGLENRFRLYVCTPLIRTPGILFDFTNIETGLVNFISPTHVHLGGFFNLTPLSFLVLRAEVTGLFIWPLPLAGAGYIPLSGYQPFNDNTLNPPNASAPVAAGRGYGVRTLLGATLQGQLPLGRHASLALLDAFVAEYWRVNGIDSPAGLNYYYLSRDDVIARAGGEWVLDNTAVLLAIIDLSKNYLIRVGVTDDLTIVPANNNYLGNLVAGLLAFMVKDAGGLVRNLQVFVRAGAYTEHAFRTGATLAAGLEAIYDLTPGSWRQRRRY